MPAHLLTCHQRHRKANNAVKGWDHKINRHLGRPQSRIMDVVKRLKSEAEKCNQLYMTMELNFAGNKGRRIRSWMTRLREATNVRRNKSNYEIIKGNAVRLEIRLRT